MSMGHEFMGIVESTGPNVKSVKVGDRVVSAFDIACGQCFFCEKVRPGSAGRSMAIRVKQSSPLMRSWCGRSRSRRATPPTTQRFRACCTATRRAASMVRPPASARGRCAARRGLARAGSCSAACPCLCCGRPQEHVLRQASALHQGDALAGYSDLTGGYEGGQAEYARVPFGALWPTACCSASSLL